MGRARRVSIAIPCLARDRYAVGSPFSGFSPECSPVSGPVGSRLAMGWSVSNHLGLVHSLESPRGNQPPGRENRADGSVSVAAGKDRKRQRIKTKNKDKEQRTKNKDKEQR